MLFYLEINKNLGMMSEFYSDVDDSHSSFAVLRTLNGSLEVGHKVIFQLVQCHQDVATSAPRNLPSCTIMLFIARSLIVNLDVNSDETFV